MKKNYIYLTILIFCTVVLTFFLSFLYKRDEIKTSYSYEKLNKITATEFKEYMIEHPDTIIYIADKNNLNYNKFEKKLINKLKNMNLLENIVYIEKSEFSGSLENLFKKEYSYVYNETNLPSIIVINDGKIIEFVAISENSNVETLINYEVFE